MVALFVLLTIITLLTVDYFVQRAELARAGARAGSPAIRSVAPRPVPVDQVPRGVFLDRGHTWVQVEPSGALRLGADLFPAALLGKPDRIEIAPAGTQLRAGDPVAVLHLGSRSVTLRAPMDGVVARVNEDVARDPARIRNDPFGSGWLVGLDPGRSALAPALKRMLVAEDAVAWVRRELGRVRDLLAGPPAPGALVPVTLQDGGLPLEGFGLGLDDESFEHVVRALFAESR